MLPWRMVIVGLFYCAMKTGVTQGRTNEQRHSFSINTAPSGGAPPIKTLFPAASKFKRGVASLENPIFHNSFGDVHLLYEILLTGIQFEVSGAFSVKDAELASLRKTQNLEVICEEIIPRKLTDIFRLISGLSNHIGHLHQDDFERSVLTLVYIAQRMVSSTTKHQRDIWAESFVGLYKVIKQDLAGTNRMDTGTATQ